ncbi:hypothetical protein QNO07_20610 [Streptomyces sp. 549]|uniref:hypothetical protein n=1 Tax=Streptomyces sp. 549 TaxID=3049076 RepID=UPI0024C234B9|nr:hypothetical protein [Streptomyces sp. 549]MDK1475790.1 hypothetical protein [Streptomyces sp. 549]
MTETAGKVKVCSLKRASAQIVPSGSYTIVRFPFGSPEPHDAHGMHQLRQPNGHTIRSWDKDDRSGLIWPSHKGWGSLYAMVHWEDGRYTELRDQFVRDPLGFGPNPVDTTATDHRPRSIGIQCFTKAWAMFVSPRTPLALRVAHNHPGPRKLVLAELKLVIHDA